MAKDYYNASKLDPEFQQIFDLVLNDNYDFEKGGAKTLDYDPYSIPNILVRGIFLSGLIFMLLLMVYLCIGMLLMYGEPVSTEAVIDISIMSIFLGTILTIIA